MKTVVQIELHEEKQRAFWKERIDEKLEKGKRKTRTHLYYEKSLVNKTPITNNCNKAIYGL